MCIRDSGRTIQWYGFGKQEELYVRVNGGTTTTGPYSAVLECIPVIPTAISDTILEGSLTIKEGPLSSADTDFWVYNSNLDAIATYGHDDEDATGLVRPFTPGTYYIPWANWNTANNQGSPTDDTYRTANVLDFPNVVANSSSTNITNNDLNIIHSAGTAAQALTRPSPFDVNWVSFLVSPVLTPTNPSCMAGAAPAIVRNDGVSNTTTLTVVVTPGNNPPSVTHTVDADLSAFGVIPVPAPFTEGPPNTFTYNLTVPPGTLAGAYTITTTVRETAPMSRQSTCTATLNVINTPTGQCCTSDGCQVLTETACATAMGIYGGDNTSCTACACAVAPLNDTCDTAELIVANDVRSGSTCLASAETSLPTCGQGGLVTTGSVWYKVIGTGNTMTASLCGAVTNYDSKMSVYCGDCMTGFTCVDGDDDDCPNNSSIVTFCTQNTATYYIVVHGFSTGRGNFQLALTDDGAPCTATVRCVATGACCLSASSSCVVTTQADCMAQGGSYLGDASACQTIVTAQFVSADAFPIAIPDSVGGLPGSASSTIVIGPDNGDVNALSVKVGLTHTWVGDLIVTLTNGVHTVDLMRRVGTTPTAGAGDSSNLGGNYIFFDTAAGNMWAVAASLDTAGIIPGGEYFASDATGALSPLAAFDGDPFEGTWTLTVSDNAGADIGTITSFCLNVFPDPIVTENCSFCPPCAADYNQDGGVTGDDVGAFFDDFENGRACADVNEDGGITGEDVERFFMDFEAGNPNC